MAAGDFTVQGTFTLSASAPGVIASVDVAATGAAASSTVLITPTESAIDGNGSFNYKITEVTTNQFTVKADREQLPNDVDFMFIVFEGA